MFTQSTPTSGKPRSYADGYGITIEEFLARCRAKEAPPLFHNAHVPADRRPLSNPYVKEK